MADWVLPEIEYERCTRCGACVRRCPTGALEMQEMGPVIARPEACTYCTFCESLCPEGAIRCSFEIVWGARARSADTVRDRPELD